MGALAGLGTFGIIIAILFFVAPLGIWNRLVEIHRTIRRNNKTTEALLERIAVALERAYPPSESKEEKQPERYAALRPSTPKPPPPPPHKERVPGHYSRKWMS